MTNIIGRGLEIIGVRAVILDVRNYVADGKKIEAANAQMGASIAKLDALRSKQLGQQQALAQAQAKLARVQGGPASQEALTKAIQAQNLANLAAGKANDVATTAALRLTNAQKAAAAAQKQLKETSDALAASQGKIRTPGAGLQPAASQAEQQKLIAAQSAAQKQVSATNAAQLAALQGAQGAAGTKAIANARAATAALTVTQLQAGPASKELAAAQKEVAAAEKALQATTIKLSAAEAAQTGIEQKLDATQKARIATIIKLAAVAGLIAVGLFTGGAITQAASFQQELTKVNVLTEATDEQTKQLGDDFLKLSQSMPVSATDLLKSAYVALSSGIKDIAQAEEIAINSAKAATFSQADQLEITRAVIAVLKGYPSGTITATQAIDILTAGVQQGNAEFSDFAGSIGRVIPIANALNVPFDQVAASLAVLTNGGLDAEEAATGLRAILNNLAKGDASPAAAKALETVGLTFGDLRKEIKEKGLPETMVRLFDLFKNNLAAIEPIIPNIRGMVAAYAAFSVNGGEAARVLVDIDNASGITNEGFEKAKNNVNNLARVVKNDLVVLLIQAGTVVLPQLSKALRDLTGWWQKNQKDIQEFVNTGMKVLIATLIDVVRGIGLVVGMFTSLLGNKAAIIAAIVAIGAAFAFALPGGPVIVGLTAIIGIMGELSREGGLGDRVADKINSALGLKVGKFSLGDVQKQLEKEGGTIEDAIKKFVPEFAQKNLINTLKEAGLDVTKGVEELKRYEEAQKAAAGVTGDTTIKLGALNSNIDDTGIVATAAAQELEKLASDFQSTSEAASQVERLIDKLGLFGRISQKLAETLNLSAVASGNVQGADAVRAAQDRATQSAFNFTQALATVAQAFQQSASVAQSIVLGIARSALQASQQAAAALFQRPTREVASLNVSLAGANLATAQTRAANNPQIANLQRQLAAINQQISRASQSAQTSQRQSNSASNAARTAAAAAAAGRQRDDALNALKEANQAAHDIAANQLDQMRLAQAVAKAAADLADNNFERLIRASQFQQSQTQIAFLAANEDLQKQINEAIASGNTSGALALTDQQQEAAKAFQSQNKDFIKQQQDLAKARKDAQLAASDAQITSTLALTVAETALAKADRKRALDAQIASDAAQSAKGAEASATESNTTAFDNNTSSLQTQAQAIQDQIDSLTSANEAQGSHTQSIQDTIAVYQAQSDLIKAQIDAADATLLTQDEQRKKAQELIEQIAIESQAVRDLANATGVDLIPEMDAAREQFRLLQSLLQVLTDESLRANLIDRGIDPAAKALELLALAAGESTKKIQSVKITPPGEGGPPSGIDILLAANEDLQAVAKATGELRKNTENLSQAIGDGTASIAKATSEGSQSVDSAFSFSATGVSTSSQRIVTALNSTSLGVSVAGNNLAASITSSANAITIAARNAVANAGKLAADAAAAAAKAATAALGGKKAGQAEGGIFSTPTTVLVGETFQREAIIPLERPARARQIISSIPPNVLANILPRGGSGMVFAPNIQVSGETLETMEMAAVRAVHAAFGQARITSIRRGSLLAQGLGPSR